MSIAESMVQELEVEAAMTRQCLERVPEEHLGWKPHEKSMTLGRLASHLVEGLQWAVITAQTEVFDFNPMEYKGFEAGSRAELLQAFDDRLKEATEALSKVSDEEMFRQWKMTAMGQTVLEMPKIVTIRSMILSHMIHHRGQLTVYLRLKDVPLPSIYGPTADEQPAWAS